MIKLGNFTILLDEEKGRYYIPELQETCQTLSVVFDCITTYIKTAGILSYRKTGLKR